MERVNLNGFNIDWFTVKFTKQIKIKYIVRFNVKRYKIKKAL